MTVYLDLYNRIFWRLTLKTALQIRPTDHRLHQIKTSFQNHDLLVKNHLMLHICKFNVCCLQLHILIYLMCIYVCMFAVTICVAVNCNFKMRSVTYFWVAPPPPRWFVYIHVHLSVQPTFQIEGSDLFLVHIPPKVHKLTNFW